MDEEKFEAMRAEYRRHLLGKYLFIAACVAFVTIAIAVSITIGGYDISMTEVYETIFNHIFGDAPERYSKEWYDDEIVWNTRLPRVLFAVVAGFGLAVSGVTMQSIMRNPLAEPYTTGVSSGASLGVALSLAFGISVLPISGTAPTAFAIALFPVMVMIALSPRFNDSVATIILIGTALTYLFNAMSTFILVTTDEDTLANIYRWQVGSFANLGWDELTMVAVVAVAGSAAISLLSNRLNLLTMGDESAKSLGVNVKRLRIVCLLIMAAMVAFIVAYSGIVGFVGLICPHVIRLAIGSDNRFVIPASAAFGAAFLLAADTIAKCLSSLDVVPVGAIASLIGAPVFLMILIRNRRDIW